jgi:hypothetical protein
MQDRYLAVIWKDEYGVPTAQVLTYFAEVPGDKEGILDHFSQKAAFQLLGDFSDLESATSIMERKLGEMASAIPPWVRAKWPSEEDRRYVEACRICGFSYCPRLPKDAQQHSRMHADFVARQ